MSCIGFTKDQCEAMWNGITLEDHIMKVHSKDVDTGNAGADVDTGNAGADVDTGNSGADADTDNSSVCNNNMQ